MQRVRKQRLQEGWEKHCEHSSTHVTLRQKFSNWIQEVFLGVARILLRNSGAYVLLLNFKFEPYFQIQFFILLLTA